MMWIAFLSACQAEPLDFGSDGSVGPLDAVTICHHHQRWKESGVSEDALKQALMFIQLESAGIKNTRSFAIADYSKPSTVERFYVFNWKDGSYSKSHVSHGSGYQDGKKWGDPEHDGVLNRCQRDGDQSNMTRVGFFSVAEFYWSSSHANGKWPVLKVSNSSKQFNGIRMDGLSSTNKEARSRGVVMHEASYNKSKVMGRSYGCPAFRPGEGAAIMERLQSGGIYYSYAPQCSVLHKSLLQSIPGWEEICK